MLLSDEATAGKIGDDRLVDWRAFELDGGDILGKRQLGNGELVLDRPGLLLVDLGVAQVADDALRSCCRLMVFAMTSSNAAFMP